MNTKNNKARKKSQERLINAYLELLDTHKREDINIKTLIAKAHVNRSTFYNNYQNIDDFFHKIVTQTNGILFNELKQLNLSNFSIDQQIYIASFIKEHQKEYSLSYELNFYTDSFISDIFMEILLKKYPTDMAHYRMVGIVGGCNAIIIDWIKNKCDLDPKSLAKIIYEKCINEI